MPDAASPATSADVELGRSALLEVTPASTIGEPIGSADEGDGVVSVYFGVTKPGYPGWRWTTTIAHVEGAEPTVLETEMTPGDGALLAPEWVPWVDRLADYHAAQDAAALAAEDNEHDGPEDELDDDPADDDSPDDDSADDDSDDDDSDGDVGEDLAMRSRLHAGDLDGVDIDSLDEEDEEGEEPEVEEPEVEESEATDDDASAAPSASTADDVDQPEDAEHDAERAGDEPVGTEPAEQRADQQ